MIAQQKQNDHYLPEQKTGFPALFFDSGYCFNGRQTVSFFHFPKNATGQPDSLVRDLIYTAA
jgi:hypothetical protein